MVTKRKKVPRDVVGLLRPEDTTTFRYAHVVVNNPNVVITRISKSTDDWYYIFFKFLGEPPHPYTWMNELSEACVEGRPRRIFV